MSIVCVSQTDSWHYFWAQTNSLLYFIRSTAKLAHALQRVCEFCGYSIAPREILKSALSIDARPTPQVRHHSHSKHEQEQQCG